MEVGCSDVWTKSRCKQHKKKGKCSKEKIKSKCQTTCGYCEALEFPGTVSEILIEDLWNPWGISRNLAGISAESEIEFCGSRPPKPGRVR